MKYIPTIIPDVWIMEPERHVDARGWFCETYRAADFAAATGLNPVFVQDNESLSCRGVIRGLHFQAGEAAQAKLVRVTAGAIVDVVLDIRPGSPTFGQHIMVELSAENGRQLFMPRGMAHGFCVISEQARFQYKVDNYWAPAAERTIRPDDPALAIAWPIPVEARILSPKDALAHSFADVVELL